MLLIVTVTEISFGVAMKYGVSDNKTYKNKVEAKKAFKYKGEEFVYTSPDEVGMMWYDKTAYKDGIILTRIH